MTNFIVKCYASERQKSKCLKLIYQQVLLFSERLAL